MQCSQAEVNRLQNQIVSMQTEYNQKLSRLSDIKYYLFFCFIGHAKQSSLPKINLVITTQSNVKQN